MALHWHGDTFDIPERALHLAKSECCPNQAFIYRNRVVGLQFHLESSGETIDGLLENDCPNIASHEQYVQTSSDIRNGLHHLRSCHEMLYSFMDKWTKKKTLKNQGLSFLV